VFMSLVDDTTHDVITIRNHHQYYYRYRLSTNYYPPLKGGSGAFGMAPSYFL